MKETDFRRPVLYDAGTVFYKHNVIGDATAREILMDIIDDRFRETSTIVSS